MASEATAPAYEGWAILELMGHRQRAGQVREVEMAGGRMLRLDIPVQAEAGMPATVTEFYSAAALYALRPCSEELARNFAAERDPRPARPVHYRDAAVARLPGDQRSFADDDDDRPF